MHPVPAVAAHPVVTAAPLLTRLKQSSAERTPARFPPLIDPTRQYLDNPEDRLPLANALKYFSALPVIALSALKYHVPLSRWTSAYRPLWLLSSFANSGMSFCWDVAVDWDLPVLTACCGGLGRSGAAAMGGLLLRADLLYGAAIRGHEYSCTSPERLRIFDHSAALFLGTPAPANLNLNATAHPAGRPALYYFAILTNACLRISWTYKLSSHLRHNQRTVFVVRFIPPWKVFWPISAPITLRRSGQLDTDSGSAGHRRSAFPSFLSF